MKMLNAFDRLWDRLAESKSFRQRFVVSQVKQSIPLQIRTMMKAHGLSQQGLAERCGLKQGSISRAASPKYGNLSLNTLVRIAAGFDVAFVGRFVPFSELTHWVDQLQHDPPTVPTFDEEYGRLNVLQHTTFDTAAAVRGLERALASAAGMITSDDLNVAPVMNGDETTVAATYVVAR